MEDHRLQGFRYSYPRTYVYLALCCSYEAGAFKEEQVLALVENRIRECARIEYKSLNLFLVHLLQFNMFSD